LSFDSDMSLGIYVQVPFCQTKCTYCNFHAGPAARGLYAPYVNAVVREITDCRSLYVDAGVFGGRVDSEAVDTIYLGGGTPSLLDSCDLARIVEAVRASFPHELAEVTLEADPETISEEKAAEWLAAGIQRVSMGAQSFQDAELTAAGRMHRRSDIFSALKGLQDAGFRNISLDLIAGLPHQTSESWRESLRELLQLRPEHISIYLLEIDEGSRLGREVLAGGSRYGAARVPDEDAMAASYEQACAELADSGYEHYEISNWALPGFHSRHNLKYWRREPYLGFGAGAHSFDGGQRWANAHDPAQYVASIQRGRLPIEQLQEIHEAQALEEEMFLGLRQLAGVDVERIEREYRTQLWPRVEPLVARGLLERDGRRLRLTPRSLTVSNEVFVEFLA
jgi:putative oxygen-independent coproporphyrinogen III oxidase